MKVKSRAFVFFAAVSLSLCLSSSVLAQGSSVTTTVNVEAGACTGSITSGVVDFGKYTFDGEFFNLDTDGGSNTTFTVAAVDETVAQEGCAVELVASELTLEGATSTITVSLTDGTQAQANTIELTMIDGSSVDVTASIDAQLNKSVVVGTYNGTITVTGPASSG